MGVGLYSDLE